MKLRTQFAALGLGTLAFLIPSFSPAADWVPVESNDKKVVVMFPHKAEEFETVSTKTPAGSVKTEVSKYLGDGIMLTISDTTLPGLAVAFAGKETILKNGAAGVVSKALGKEISSEMTEVDGAPGLVLRYASANFENSGHPGYQGLAVLFMVDKQLYTINAVLSKENPENQAAQERLLNSIKIKN